VICQAIDVVKKTKKAATLAAFDFWLTAFRCYEARRVFKNSDYEPVERGTSLMVAECAFWSQGTVDDAGGRNGGTWCGRHRQFALLMVSPASTSTKLTSLLIPPAEYDLRGVFPYPENQSTRARSRIARTGHHQRRPKSFAASAACRRSERGDFQFFGGSKFW